MQQKRTGATWSQRKPTLELMTERIFHFDFYPFVVFRGNVSDLLG